MATSPAQTWALFIASSDEHLLQEITERQNGKVNRYLIHTVNVVAGKLPGGLAPDWSVVRFEKDDPIRFADESHPALKASLITFRGMTQNLHYTTVAQSQELEARSRAEFEPSNETIAVLIPIGKSLEWWQLAQDKRQAHFQISGGYQGHTAIGIRYVDRVFRKLYHSRYTDPLAPYDFLTYFEFNSAHKGDFNALLDELRDTSRNPEWAHVELEYEIWMTKIG